MRIGLIGLGAMGRTHFECWLKSSRGKLVAVSDRSPKKLAGDWSGKEFNLGDQAASLVDMSGLATYLCVEDLLADPSVDAVDICMPTPLHAPLAIAAMRAGKDVFCEKPVALSMADCEAMRRVATETGRQLVVGHCLRYWPQYVKAHELILSGEYGRVLHASFHRSSGAPGWSSDAWYLRGGESGGVLDMHIHDVDVALWWFGRPQAVVASGLVVNGLPLVIDAAWAYSGGPQVQIHGSWDLNGGVFRHAFRVVMEGGTLVHDMAIDAKALQLFRGGKCEEIVVEDGSAYQNELEAFAEGRAGERIGMEASQLALEIGLEELRQIT